MHEPVAGTVGLVARLRAATRASHEAVESSPLMQRLIEGTIDHTGYGAYLAALAPVYQALESRLAHEGSRGPLAALAQAVPPRLPGLLADLTAVGHQPGHGGVLAERIVCLDGAQAHRLTAWAWVRYGGDLAGGQLLARALGAALGLAAGAGLDFYVWPPDRDARTTRAALRSAIDGLVLTEAERDDVEDEAAAAFRLHGELFSDLLS